LVADARCGHESAFTELYRRYADRVYRFCLFRVHRPADAEDLMQQTFVRAIEALPRYEERGLPFGAWLFRIARNVVIDFQRSCRDHVDLEALTLTGADPSIEDDTDGLAERDALLGALARLTPDQREVLGYRFFADLSARETGRLMDRDEATIRGLQARALGALRRQFRAIEAASGEAPVLVRSAHEPDDRVYPERAGSAGGPA
jgi:RNA polymerase sigma-70 factor (ECF subfamily)